MRWPWQSAPVEHRSSYTDQVVAAILQSASGGGVRPPLATAALESAAQMYAAALASCSISGPSVVTRALDASWRANVASELVRRGQCVYIIGADPVDGFHLAPVSHWDVHGGPRPSSWVYRCELAGPSGTAWETHSAAAVLHLRWLVDHARPWAGVSPLQRASDTGSLAGWLEKRLSEEASGPVGSFLPVAKYDADPDADLDADDDPLAALRRDIGNSRGQVLAVESAMAAADSPASAPRKDFQVARFGANPPRDLVELRRDVALDIAGRAESRARCSARVRAGKRRARRGACSCRRRLTAWRGGSKRKYSPSSASRFGSIRRHSRAGTWRRARPRFHGFKRAVSTLATRGLRPESERIGPDPRYYDPNFASTHPGNSQAQYISRRERARSRERASAANREPRHNRTRCLVCDLVIERPPRGRRRYCENCYAERARTRNRAGRKGQATCARRYNPERALLPPAEPVIRECRICKRPSPLGLRRWYCQTCRSTLNNGFIQRLVRARRAAGLCVRCGAVTVNGQASCARCLSDARARYDPKEAAVLRKRLLDTRRARASCANCASEVATGRARCAACLSDARARHKRERAGWRASGRCGGCGRTPRRGRSLCQVCVSGKKKVRANNVGQGFCRCGRFLAPGRKNCPTCLTQAKKRQRVRRDAGAISPRRASNQVCY